VDSSSQCDVPRSPALASAGCRLVGRLNFRRSESRRLVMLEDGKHAASPSHYFTTTGFSSHPGSLRDESVRSIGFDARFTPKARKRVDYFAGSAWGGSPRACSDRHGKTAVFGLPMIDRLLASRARTDPAARRKSVSRSDKTGRPAPSKPTNCGRAHRSADGPDRCSSCNRQPVMPFIQSSSDSRARF
jgi:hypothetical protein